MIAFDQLDQLDQLDQFGYAKIGQLLDATQCRNLIDGYETDAFRARIDMARYSFGRGEYRYYDYPLPDAVDSLLRC